jgi:UDP-N-acetylglucosamine diphosphorylase / glucose-1-phosphate thymidylyltransferase / UDP-N-acetylgalactosamine diphosphorylase / glucosamine-1-phosphate N-acetyltransferase / galactosamine-1-phosphate N-acetyltransferase
MTEREKVLRDDPRLPELFDDPPDEVMRFILAHGIFGMIGGKGSARWFRTLMRDYGADEGYGPWKGDDSIVVHKSAKVHDNAEISGPVLIGPNCEVRAFSVIRGGTWLVEDCVVGHFCEVKNSLFLQGARASHHNYVGDSILGAGANLGAGVKLGNLRLDRRKIRVVTQDGTGHIETGLDKFGVILGDNVQIGCGVNLAPGMVIGAGAWFYNYPHPPPGVYEGGRRYWCVSDIRSAAN